ncbi:MAG: hypothetical protein PF518_19950 [Spirochaetaceae bacterium]|jgi:hypothetical protein|nr:hypothetical protein [Spirochaetaceae bacterium]
MKKYIILDEKSYQGEWPFTKKRIMITAEGFALYVRVGHKKYNLNGVAKRGRELEYIWKMKDGCDYRVSISGIINIARKELL